MGRGGKGLEGGDTGDLGWGHAQDADEEGREVGEGGKEGDW